VPRAADGHAKTRGDVTQRKILEAGQLQRQTLPRRQAIDQRVQDPPAFITAEAGAGLDEWFAGDLDRIAAVRGAAPQDRLSPQRPVVDVLQQPDTKRSARRRIEMRLPVDLEEHLLCDVFGFAVIVQDAVCDPGDEADVPVKDPLERVRAFVAHLADQFGIGLLGLRLHVTLDRCYYLTHVPSIGGSTDQVCAVHNSLCLAGSPFRRSRRRGRLFCGRSGRSFAVSGSNAGSHRRRWPNWRP